MFKKISFAIFMFTSFLFVGQVYAGGLGASAGVFVPSSGDFSSGYSMTVFGDIDVVPMIAVRVQGLYSKAESKQDRLYGNYGKQTLTTTGGEVLLKATAPIPFITVYGAAGWGYYYNNLAGGGIDKNYTGNGLVLKAGISKTFLVATTGVNVAYRQNKTSFRELGGTTVSFFAGFAF